VDCAGGVSTVSPGTRIGPGNRWKSGRGVSSDAHTSGGGVGAIPMVPGVSQPSVSQPGVSVTWVAQNVGISLSLPFGNMDDTSRVGDITSSTSVSSSDSRDGSRGSSKGGERGRGGNVGVAGSNWSNGSNRGNSSSDRGHSGDSRGSVAKTGIAITQTSISQSSVAKTICTIEGISLSLPLGHMDDSGRVGDITSGTSVSSSDSGNSSRGKASNVHGCRGGDTGIAGSNRGHSSDGSSNRSDSSNCRGSIAKASIAETSIAKTVGTIESISISLSLPLGDMDDTSRVGNITSSTSISSSDSRDGSRGKSSNVHRGRRRDTGVASSIWGSVPGVTESSQAGITSIAKPGIASTVAKEVGVSLSCGCRSKEESCKELVHVGLWRISSEHYPLWLAL